MHVPVEYDVIVVGGGPAGASAAISAARLGAKTLLIEMNGYLGGIFTAGLLSWVLDAAGKQGFLSELISGLRNHKGYLHTPHPKDDRYDGSADFAYDSEGMKYLLDELCADAGVDVLLYSRAVDSETDRDRITGVVVENYDGRRLYRGKVFLDCTGNGEFASRAGNEFSVGHPESGRIQPATLVAIVTGFPSNYQTTSRDSEKKELYSLFEQSGVSLSYRNPVFVRLPNPQLACLIINHEYDVACDDTFGISHATIHGRKEINKAVKAISGNPDWRDLRIAATASSLGLREGRRLKGRYTVSKDDIIAGRRFDDGICLVGLPVDVHGLTSQSEPVSREGIITRPYHIPLRSLLSHKFENLGFAGRCIDGDFFAHASYRVTGNAVPLGEAAGITSALAADTAHGKSGRLANVGADEVRAVLLRAGHQI